MAVLSILFLLLFVAHRISAQDPICSPSFGENIMYQDCQSAISASYVLASPILDTFPQHWSRDSAVLGGKMYHMPQAHTWKTCAIGIDLVDAPDNIHGKLTPRALKDIVEHMLRTCSGSGGSRSSSSTRLLVLETARAWVIPHRAVPFLLLSAR